jgi:hypothetical protein
MMKSRMRWAGKVARMGGGVHIGLVRKPEGKNPLVRPRCRWVDNINMDLTRDRMGMDWIDLAQDRDQCRALVKTVMNLRVP